MVVNYAAKFDNKVDERFAKEALSTGIINQDFDFTGVDTVKVYSVPTSGMNDYKTTGQNRYGEAEELGNTVLSRSPLIRNLNKTLMVSWRQVRLLLVSCQRLLSLRLTLTALQQS